MIDHVQIARRFNGPPDSANGGYACGVVAEAVRGRTARVSLRLPPPLDVLLRRTRAEDGTVVLADGGSVIAQGAPAELAVRPPEAPSLDAAAAASERSSAHTEHPFPTCFVCGPARGSNEGLRILPGPLDDTSLVASPWQPPPDLTTGGVIDPRVVWAALDCPGGFASRFERSAVLAGMTASLLSDVRADAAYVVVGWPIGRDGRKYTAGSAIYARDGTPAAVAEALWIELRDPRDAGTPA
jgi:hypothetical protein